jgi:mannose-6-phosphate isomerase-like protein (cupin superfamily)
MHGVTADIKKLAKRNQNFRQVVDTGEYVQVVVMSIPPGGEIGEEVHLDTDQVLYLVDGEGEVILDGERADIREGDLVLVRAGVRHNFVNTDDEDDLKIITMYAPPHHPVGTIHATKADADQAELVHVS